MDIKRRANHISKLVQKFWRNCEKVIKHNYNVEYERKKQKVREKKLNYFVNKHLKLSGKVASSLHEKTKSASIPLVKREDQQVNTPIVVESNEALPVMGSKVTDDHVVFDDDADKFTVNVKKLQNGTYEFES